MLIYDKNTPLNLTSFANNGLGYLKDFKTSPKITEELNSKGMFTGNLKLEFDYAKDGLNAEYLQELNYIKANYNGSYQIFYIENIIKSLKKISVYARHIFFILKNGFIEDTRPTNVNALSAMNSLLSVTQFSGVFNVNSDVSGANTAYYIRKNIIESLITADNSLLSVWNCDLKLDNFTIDLLNQRGSNNGISIEYGKNLTGIDYLSDYSTVATRIMPQGANELLLPEKYVDSPLIGNYPFIFIQHIEFDDVSVSEDITEEEAYDVLRDRVNQLYENGIDKPNINIKVDWQDVSKTEEYKKYSYFENIQLGDIVNIKFSNMNFSARVIKTIFDVLSQKYTFFELGNVKADFLKMQKATVKEEVRGTLNIDSLLTQAQNNATTLITNAFLGYKYITQNEIYIMDDPDPIQAVKLWRWNLNGLGYSSDGIDGPYELAMTMDGSIVADRITTGKLNTSVIEGYDSLSTTVSSLDTSINGDEKTDANLITLSDGNITENGLTITTENNTITINGTASIDTYYELNSVFFDVSKYLIDGLFGNLKLVINNSDEEELYNGGNGYFEVTDEFESENIKLFIPKDTTFNNEDLNIVLAKVTNEGGILENLNTIKEALETVNSTMMTQTATAFEMLFTQTGIQNTVDTLQELTNGNTTDLNKLSEYIRFEGAKITLGKNDSQASLIIANDRISFMIGTNESAYITGNQLYITDSTILRKLQVGHWVTEEDSYGNLNTKWVGDN